MYFDNKAALVVPTDMGTKIMMNLEKVKKDWPFSIGRAMEYFDKINISEVQLKDGRDAIKVRVEKNNRYEAIVIPVAGRNVESFTLFVGWFIKRTADDFYNSEEESKPMYPKNIIFNGPATIVEWYDGTKTVVKCQRGDTFDPLTGVAMCCMKKMLGSNESGSNYLSKVEGLIDEAIAKKDERYKKNEAELRAIAQASDDSWSAFAKKMDEQLYKAIDEANRFVQSAEDNKNGRD